MTPLWTSADAAQATGGKTSCIWQASGVSIDTRSLQKGDLFVALSDTRDGHDFVAQALEKGAAAALVSHVPDGVAKDAPLLLVDDVLAALGDLARAARTRTQARIVAVTGSVGKTSTKEMLRTVLARQGRTHAAAGSYNNHWGVPLTLARMPANSQFAVIEIGMNHPGEIAPLAQMTRPHVALITNVAAVHMAAFDDIMGIAHEKAALFSGLESQGTAVINADQATADILFNTAKDAEAKIVSFGADHNADFHIENLKLTQTNTIIHANSPNGPLLLKLAIPGRHFALNALATLAAAQALGADLTVAALDLASWSPPKGRGAREMITLDLVDDHLSLTLLDDAFNASPISMAAALDVLAASQPTPPGRRIAILGDMLELGPDEATFHAAIASLPATENIDTIHCVGPRMMALYGALDPSQKGDWVEKAPEMAARVHGLVQAGDVILIKGSKGSKVSLVVDAIRKLGHPQTQKTQGIQ
ncbi:MAG: UDP-N-acetylmuramoyl-tripeptide--D-alanyl-D-alanine ligase [Paracoccaceae bacterium]